MSIQSSRPIVSPVANPVLVNFLLIHSAESAIQKDSPYETIYPPPLVSAHTEF